MNVRGRSAGSRAEASRARSNVTTPAVAVTNKMLVLEVVVSWLCFLSVWILLIVLKRTGWGIILVFTIATAGPAANTFLLVQRRKLAEI